MCIKILKRFSKVSYMKRRSKEYKLIIEILNHLISHIVMDEYDNEDIAQSIELLKILQKNKSKK